MDHFIENKILPSPRIGFELTIFCSLKITLTTLHLRVLSQRTLTYFVRGSITIQLTSCLTGVDSAALLMLNYIDIYMFG